MNSFEQSYIPLFKKGNQWNLLYQNYAIVKNGTLRDTIIQSKLKCKKSFDESLKTQILKVSNDTMINGTIYQKIISSFDSLASNWSLEALVREDTATKKVFRRISDNDYLLYDFNLKPKDTVYVEIGQIVDTVYTTIIYNLLKLTE